MQLDAKIQILIKVVTEKANLHDREVFAVGGFIRDLILGRETTDIDFVVDNNTAAFAKIICSHLRGRMIRLDEINRIYRVIAGNYNLDFSQMQGRDIKKDLSRRDFTVNAIAVKLEHSHSETIFQSSSPDLIDPFGGLRDIKHKTIRSVAEKNFVDDPLRLIRTFRFSAQLGFKIEPDTLKQVRKHLRLISKPARERVRDELVKIFDSARAPEAVEEMDSCGLLGALFPEVMRMKKSARKYYYHPKGLLQHSIEALYSANDILRRPEKYFPDVTEQFNKHIEGRKWLLKFVALTHDLAKPFTVHRIGGKVRFFGHEELGGKNIYEILGRMRFSVKERRYAKHLVENHMRPGNLSSAGAAPSPKARYRFFRDLGEESVDILVLALADRLSYMRITKKPREIREFKHFICKMVKDFFVHKKKISKPRLVDGYQLMGYLNIGPGKAVGELLKILEQAQHLGKIKTPAQALALAEKRKKRILIKYEKNLPVLFKKP